METKILHGRGFDDDDLFPSQHAVILSDALARRLFPNGDALGKSMRFDVPRENAPWRTRRRSMERLLPRGVEWRRVFNGER
jgi:hypothetical protein